MDENRSLGWYSSNDLGAGYQLRFPLQLGMRQSSLCCVYAGFPTC